MLWDTLDRIRVGVRGSGFRSPLLSFLFWASVSPALGLPRRSVVTLELTLSRFRWVYQRVHVKAGSSVSWILGQWGISASYP